MERKLTPEELLFHAVIEQMVKDARQGNLEDKQNAIEWFRNGDEDEGFLYMCELIGVDADGILTRLFKEGVL